MKFNAPTLDYWAVFNDCLVGEAINHPDFDLRQRIISNKCIRLDKELGVAFCAENEVWQLGQPGQLGRYVDPISRRFF